MHILRNGEKRLANKLSGAFNAPPYTTLRYTAGVSSVAWIRLCTANLTLDRVDQFRLGDTLAQGEIIN